MRMCPLTRVLFMALLHNLYGVQVTLCADEDDSAASSVFPDGDKRAWACYGNYRNFLDISCPADRQVKLLSMMNGAKVTEKNCPFMTTVEDNFRQDCCTFAQGDCVIEIHRNNFPVECSGRHFCHPQSRMANTGPTCNSNIFPKFTHYTEITYRCVLPSVSKETTATTTTATATATLTFPNSLAAVVPQLNNGSINTAGNTAMKTADGFKPQVVDSNRTGTTAHMAISHSKQPIVATDVTESDNFTPAMIGGMIAGIVGLMLTIFIFMFYWGRKKQVHISGKPTQNSVWDFLLANTMSVRAFRGYDNFSSSSSSDNSVQGRRPSVSMSSEDDGGGGVGVRGHARDGGGGARGQGVVESAGRRRPADWLPNISVDSGQGESNLTSDDNCSIVTLDRTTATYGSFRNQPGGRGSLRAKDGATSGIVLVPNRL